VGENEVPFQIEPNIEVFFLSFFFSFLGENLKVQLN
jgi:hypothetical protein